MAADVALAEKIRLVWPHLNERQRRVLMGAEAKVRGRGGISQVAEASGVSWPTVQKSVREFERPGPALPPERARRAGGGRKPVELKDPGPIDALDALIVPHRPEAQVPEQPLCSRPDLGAPQRLQPGEVEEVLRPGPCLEQLLLAHMAVDNAQPNVCCRFQRLVAKEVYVPRVLPTSTLITDPVIESNRWRPRR